MNYRRLAIIAAVIAALMVAGWVSLDMIVLPRTGAALAKVVPALVNATLDQAARLTPPQGLPSGSRILLELRPVGELTLRFDIRQAGSLKRPASNASTITGILAAFERPDSSMVFTGRLWSDDVSRRLAADSESVGAVLEVGRASAPITIRIVGRSELEGMQLVGYLWIPADSLILPLRRGGA